MIDTLNDNTNRLRPTTNFAYPRCDQELDPEPGSSYRCTLYREIIYVVGGDR